MSRSANDVLQLSEKQLDTVYRQVLEPQLAGLEHLRKRFNILSKLTIASLVWGLIDVIVTFWLSYPDLDMPGIFLGFGTMATIPLLVILDARDRGRYGDGFAMVIGGIWLLSIPSSLILFFIGYRDVSLFFAGFIFVVSFQFFLRSSDAYRTAYKNVVIPQLLKHAGLDLTYTVNPEFSTKMLNDCGLLNRQVSSLTAEDGITGYLGDTAITIAEVEARQNKETLFKGLFCSAELPQKFDGWLRIYPKRNVVGDGSVAGSVYTYFGSDKFESADRVQIDDAEFDAGFRVYASSPKAAHAILTPKLMEKLIAKSPHKMKNFLTSITLSIADNMVYAAVPTTGDFLEPRASNPATDRKMLELKLEELEMMLSIIEDLNV